MVRDESIRGRSEKLTLRASEIESAAQRGRRRRMNQNGF